MKADPWTEEDVNTFVTAIFGIIFALAILFFITDGAGWIDCKIGEVTSQETYCVNTGMLMPSWHRGNRTADAIHTAELDEKFRQIDEDRKRALECYDAGSDHNASFDLFSDYNLTCAKLAYLNDHLIGKTIQKDGGYIDGQSSGLFSYGSIEGKFTQYVVEGVLATGELPRTMKYHLDCQNRTTRPSEYWFGNTEETLSITYWSESDLVMYYLDKCIESSQKEAQEG